MISTTSRPTIGDRVESPKNGKIGKIIIDDQSDLPYKIDFDDGSTDWCKGDEVHHEGMPPVKPVQVATSTITRPRLADWDTRSVEGFFKKNRYFAIPWIILWFVLSLACYLPPLEPYFAARGMQRFGFFEAAKLAIWCILCSYAIHGFIAVNHDDLVKKGLKIVKDVPYNFQSGDSSIRSSLIYFVGMMTYAFVPMRMAPAETWGIALRDFAVGYTILLVGGDAWFFMCHYAFHTKQLYKLCHKTHHTWKYPVSFAAYYITSGTHMIQEHCFTIPCLLFLPVPWSAFMFYQYYGVPGAQIQHCGFSLEELHVPFCGPLKLGHLMTVCGLGLSFVLGSQSTAMHDHHHETFQGNFQLSYSYLDRLFGTYVDTTKKSKSLEEVLLKV